MKWRFWHRSEPNLESEPQRVAPLTKYRVERLGREGTGLAENYRYRVWRNSEHVADLLHDFRFDYHWFEINGVTHDYDAGRPFPIDWERNGPIHLTEEGEERLDRILAK